MYDFLFKNKLISLNIYKYHYSDLNPVKFISIKFKYNFSFSIFIKNLNFFLKTKAR